MKAADSKNNTPICLQVLEFTISFVNEFKQPRDIIVWPSMCKLQLWLQNSKVGQVKSKLMIYQEKSCSQQWNFET